MTLSPEKQSEELNELIQLDHDAVGAYTAAIDAVQEITIRGPLTQFRGDHERHIIDLSQLVRALGGKPKERADLKGVARKMMTKIAGVVGAEAVLEAMKSNEEATNKMYEHHAAMDFPGDVLEVIERNYQDEKRHLAWVLDALRTRLWEQVPAHP
jgi:uncharacterized protein (TIGR02284 family)